MGCQGAPFQAAVVEKATLLFVWPCFAVADTFLEEDPREPQRVLDRKMQEQHLRLRDEVMDLGVDFTRASGALNLQFVSPGGRTEKVKTSKVDWRGVLIFCPGRKVMVMPGLVSDAAILEELRSCQDGRPTTPRVQ